MKKSAVVIAGLIVLGATLSFFLPSCKSCNKKEQAEAPKADTASQIKLQNSGTLTLPHADTTLIPILSKLLDDAFDACAKKDYNRLGNLIVYRGPDSLRYGQDVFNGKNNYDRNVMRITAGVMNKWNTGIESKEYSRIFDMDQQDGRKLVVLEVLFISKTNINRKFFGFLQLKNEYKIADVTSFL